MVGVRELVRTEAGDSRRQLRDPLVVAGAALGALTGTWLWRKYSSRQAMREVIATTYVDAPPEIVFAVVADPRKSFLTGNPFTHMEVVGNQTEGIGTVYRWTFTLPFGLRFTFDEVVTEWVEPGRFAYRATSGWEMDAVTALTPEDSGTRVSFTIRYRLPGVWNWLMPEWLERLGSGRAVANIRKHAERQHKGSETEAGQAVTVLESTFDIAEPPAEVFAVVGDPRSKLMWVPAIKRVEMQSDHAPGPGTRYLASSGVDGIEFIFHEEIVQWEPPHRLAYQGRSPWGRFRTMWAIEPAPGESRAHYRMNYWFPGGRLGRMLGWAATAAFGRRMSKLTATKLREVVEEKKWQPNYA